MRLEIYPVISEIDSPRQCGIDLLEPRRNLFAGFLAPSFHPLLESTRVFFFQNLHRTSQSIYHITRFRGLRHPDDTHPMLDLVPFRSPHEADRDIWIVCGILEVLLAHVLC